MRFTNTRCNRVGKGFGFIMKRATHLVGTSHVVATIHGSHG